MTGCRLAVKVVPGSSRNQIVGWLDDALKIKVAAPPEKGKANDAVIALLASQFKVSPAAIRLVKGVTASRKQFEIQGLSDEDLRRALSRD